MYRRMFSTPNEVTFSVYTHSYDPSGTRLFAGGGPIHVYFHLWLRAYSSRQAYKDIMQQSGIETVYCQFLTRDAIGDSVSVVASLLSAVFSSNHSKLAINQLPGTARVI